MTHSAHTTHEREYQSRAARKEAYARDSSFYASSGSHWGYQLKETPVADRGHINRHPMRQSVQGERNMLFRRTQADRHVGQPVPFPGDPPKAMELRLAEYAARKEKTDAQQ